MLECNGREKEFKVVTQIKYFYFCVVVAPIWVPEVAGEVALASCTCKKALARGRSGKDPPMLKSSGSQQKEERSRVERGYIM